MYSLRYVKGAFVGWKLYDFIYHGKTMEIIPAYKRHEILLDSIINTNTDIKSIAPYHTDKFSSERTINTLQRLYERRYKTEGHFTYASWCNLISIYNNKCLCCGKSNYLLPDHIIPAALGGTNNIDNIQPLCEKCNIRKRQKSTDYRPDFHKII